MVREAALRMQNDQEGPLLSVAEVASILLDPAVYYPLQFAVLRRKQMVRLTKSAIKNRSSRYDNPAL
ncbi:hypothetical protein T265_01470 [Opisthorchis viverrini]|uniref:Uncharacterized protein n=1 Tax=Opisthorchis viverrini TaxID=6198 RepID=A0A075A2C6_OPIVI|nr:hypothetical protein T265_01470 [Opisthorchis viverrini]KER32412.1 hypothetical protein T265_01470 [Opisthorchis viverrini]